MHWVVSGRVLDDVDLLDDSEVFVVPVHLEIGEETLLAVAEYHVSNQHDTFPKFLVVREFGLREEISGSQG